MSADLAITDPCVLFALRRESMYFRRRFPFQQRFPAAPCRAQFRGTLSQTVLMLETGLGAAAMETALRWCLGGPRFGQVPYRPRCVLSMGFSGALRPNLHVGDLILATEVIDSAGNCWQTHCPNEEIAECCTLGRLLTVDQLVTDPRAKQRLGAQLDALAVDMESAVLARLCAQHAVPLICLRVISDDLNTPLSPHLVELLCRGRVSPLRLMGTILRHPSLLCELWRLAGKTRFAARQLSNVASLLRPMAVRMAPLPPGGKLRNSYGPFPWPP